LTTQDRRKHQLKVFTAPTTQQEQELSFLYQASQELMPILKIEQISVVNELLLELMRKLSTSKAFLWFVDQQNFEISCRYGIDFYGNPTVRTSEAFSTSLVHSVIKSGRRMVFSAKSANQLHQCSALVVPIRFQERIFGAIELFREHESRFTLPQVRFVEEFAKSLAVAMNNIQVTEQLQSAAQEHVRQRLAADLHDAINQSLFSAALIAEVLPRVWERDVEEGRSSLQSLRVLIRGAVAELRGILGELRPEVLTEIELPALLRQLGDAFTSRSGVPVVYVVTGQGNVPIAVHEAIRKFCLEAFANIAKHARANRVIVQLKYDREAVDLRIKDDGVGFLVTNEASGKYGLMMMRERAQEVDAQLEILSSLGLGTELIWSWRVRANSG
jgi:signal transduction histidine kinase